MTHAEDIANIFKSEGMDVRPFHGMGFEADFINKELKQNQAGKFISYIQCSYDGEAEITLSTDGKIKTVSLLMTIFANKAIDAVEGVGAVLTRVYKQTIKDHFGNDNLKDQYLTPPWSAWELGGRVFYFFRPVGGWSEIAEKFGTIWRSEQLFRVQYE